jgi:hypothetical protein
MQLARVVREFFFRWSFPGSSTRSTLSGNFYVEFSMQLARSLEADTTR